MFESNLPTEIQNEIWVENRIYREWQAFRDPALKKRLNAKCLMLQAHINTKHHHNTTSLG